MTADPRLCSPHLALHTWLTGSGFPRQEAPLYILVSFLLPTTIAHFSRTFFDMPYDITTPRIQGGTFNDVGRDQTNNTYHGVVGHHVQIESMSVTCSHNGQQVVKRTMYDEFEYVKLGQIIPLETLSTEDLSGLELSYRSGRMLGRLKTRVTTCTVIIGRDKDTRLVAMMYEGEDAHKAWEHDFQYVSGIKEPGFAHLFGINQSPQIPMLIFHHMEFTPVTSMQVKHLNDFLWVLSFSFDDLVKKDYWNLWYPWFIDELSPNLPDGMQGPAKQLDWALDSLEPDTSPKRSDQVLQQFLHLFHLWGLEIDSEAGKKNRSKWVRVKDSGTFQELDDDDESFLNQNNATSSSTKPDSRTHSTQKDEEIRTSTWHSHNNTTQGSRTLTTKPSIKPTQHRQPSKTRRPSITTQVTSSCSDEGATRQELDDDDDDSLNNATSSNTKLNSRAQDIKPSTRERVRLWDMVFYWRAVWLTWTMVVVLAGTVVVLKLS